MRNIGQLSLKIDLLFGTSRLADIKTDIKQDEDTWGSDHYPIDVTLNEVHRYRKRADRISTKKIIRKNYPKVVLKKYEKRKGEKNIEEMERNLETKYQEFIRTLKEAVKEISERRKGKKDKNETIERFERDRQPKKLWDQECDEVIKQRKRALQEFRKTKQFSAL